MITEISVTILELKGRIDSTTAPALGLDAQAIADFMEEQGAPWGARRADRQDTELAVFQ